MGASVPDSKFFGIPFGTSGDKATIPEATQPSGAISYQQGFGPDYERDPGTDPLAKRVPRDETNEIYFQVTNAIKFLQLYGLPEWYEVDDTGADVSYPVLARVRHAGKAWVSIAATNTAEPGTDATKWVEDVAFNLPDLEATLAEMLAGTTGNKIATARRVASSVQRGAWNVATAGGTADALTLTLAPVPAALSIGFPIHVRTGASANTGPMTVNVNGLGAKPLVTQGGNPIISGQIPADTVFEAFYDGAAFRVFHALPATAAMAQAGVAPEAYLTPASLFDKKNPYFISTGGTNQLIPVGVDTKITNLAAPSGSYFNTGSSFATSAFTCGAQDAGTWLFVGYSAMTLATITTAGEDYRLAVARNGISGPFASTLLSRDNASTYGIIAVEAIALAAGDVVDLRVFQNTQTSRNITSTKFFGTRLGAA